MKETRFFYNPKVTDGELSKDEAQHAVRVLRLSSGDELNLMDGEGTFYRAEVTTATGHRCFYKVLEQIPQKRAWRGHIHLAMAPTKLNERVEWFVEKATEIGLDEFSFLNCQFSERKVVKTDRIEKIVVSAMKQSHKAWKPLVNPLESFRSFVERSRAGQKFICHCYEQSDVSGNASTENHLKPHLKDVVWSDDDCTVLIGPEGDFSIEEVRLAEKNGFVSVSLGTSRLRTETAALVAVHIMQLAKQI